MFHLFLQFIKECDSERIITRSPAVCWDMADRTAHGRRSVQMLWRIHLAMLIYRDRWVKVKIRISVRV